MKKISQDVFISEEPISTVGTAEIRTLKDALPLSSNNRVRLCAHKSENDVVHQMIIVLGQGGYVRPHRHTHSAESFHMIEGSLTVVTFTEDGKVTQTINLSSHEPSKAFFYRLDPNIFHTVLVKTPIAVVHEIIQGPFDRSKTQFASWAPDGSDTSKVDQFQKTILSTC